MAKDEGKAILLLEMRNVFLGLTYRNWEKREQILEYRKVYRIRMRNRLAINIRKHRPQVY